MADLHTLSEDSYKDSTLIMQFLRDNLSCGQLTVLGKRVVRLRRSPRAEAADNLALQSPACRED